ncbi:MAG: TlpA family protein disulfide reductase [Thiobacillus sp.]
MPKKLLFLCVAAVALAGGVWLAQNRNAPVDAEFWAISFPDLEGQAQAMARWRGQVIVLNFWASWCAPCREEVPDFADLRAQYRAKGVEFVGIAVDTPERVTTFLREFPVDYPILIGEGAATHLAERLGNPSGALPYTIVLDRDGRVVMRHLGRLDRGTLDAALRKFAT